MGKGVSGAEIVAAPPRWTLIAFLKTLNSLNFTQWEITPEVYASICCRVEPWVCCCVWCAPAFAGPYVPSAPDFIWFPLLPRGHCCCTCTWRLHLRDGAGCPFIGRTPVHTYWGSALCAWWYLPGGCTSGVALAGPSSCGPQRLRFFLRCFRLASLFVSPSPVSVSASLPAQPETHGLHVGGEHVGSYIIHAQRKQHSHAVIVLGGPSFAQFAILFFHVGEVALSTWVTMGCVCDGTCRRVHLLPQFRHPLLVIPEGSAGLLVQEPASQSTVRVESRMPRCKGLFTPRPSPTAVGNHHHRFSCIVLSPRNKRKVDKARHSRPKAQRNKYA